MERGENRENWGSESVSWLFRGWDRMVKEVLLEECLK